MDGIPIVKECELTIGFAWGSCKAEDTQHSSVVNRKLRQNQILTKWSFTAPLCLFLSIVFLTIS
jgi:hypothetical protein